MSTPFTSKPQAFNIVEMVEVDKYIDEIECIIQLVDRPKNQRVKHIERNNVTVSHETFRDMRKLLAENRRED